MRRAALPDRQQRSLYGSWRNLERMRSTFFPPCLALICVLTLAAPVVHASGGGHDAEKKEGTKAKAPKKARPYTSLKSWVMVDPFTLTIIQDGRIRGRFTVSFGMDVPDDDLRASAEALMPRLRDGWLSDLSLYAATSLRQRRAANIDEVSSLLQSIADKTLGKPGSKVLMAQATVSMTP